MSTDKKRLCLTLPITMAADIAEIKRLLGCSSNSATYRHLIRIGLDALKASETAKTTKERT